MSSSNILVWLPSPMGDAIMCTPALKAIRSHFAGNKIYFYGNKIVREILSPSAFNDFWIEQASSNPFSLASKFNEFNFTHAILFKNSFLSALSVFLARIPCRIGYSRECRGIFLTDKLYPSRLANGRYRPLPMVDYYAAVAAQAGAPSPDSLPELKIDQDQLPFLKSALPGVFNRKGPLIILVPGGAFGPSKCWPAKHYAQLADMLVARFGATVVVSVAPNDFEKQIALKITNASSSSLIDLSRNPVSLGRLKALISLADLVICNDTGPRHIAIALKRKVISLFGPNNPKWTSTGYTGETQIISDAPCVPCDKPVCPNRKYMEQMCMEDISVDRVYAAAEKILQDCVGKSND